MKQRRVHTREFKLDLCTRIEVGELTKAQASREHRIAPSLWTVGSRSFAMWAVKLSVILQLRSLTAIDEFVNWRRRLVKLTWRSRFYGRLF